MRHLTHCSTTRTRPLTTRAQRGVLILMTCALTLTGARAASADEAPRADAASRADGAGRAPLPSVGRAPQLALDQFASRLSGLMTRDVVEGQGTAAAAGDLVVVHYTGWLTDGGRFDSSVPRREPLSFVLGRGMVIKGWEEGVVGMRVGGQRQLVIPPSLAYGSEGRAGQVPPDATLIYEVSLLGVAPLDAAPTPRLERPATRPALTRAAGGLERATLDEGRGAEATAGDLVVVHYTGWLEDGTRFDSSVIRGVPLVFALGMGKVIQGWDDGVEGMRVGERRLLVIPSGLAYGAQGVPGAIPPGATLTFEVSLLGVAPQR